MIRSSGGTNRLVGHVNVLMRKRAEGPCSLQLLVRYFVHVGGIAQLVCLSVVHGVLSALALTPSVY